MACMKVEKFTYLIVREEKGRESWTAILQQYKLYLDSAPLGVLIPYKSTNRYA